MSLFIMVDMAALRLPAFFFDSVAIELRNYISDALILLWILMHI